MLVAAAPGLLSAQDAPASGRLPHDAVPGQIVVALGAPARVEADAVRWAGGTVNLLSLLGEDAKVSHTLRATDGIVIEAPSLRDAAGLEAALAALARDPGVVGAEPNYLYYNEAQLGDPRLGEMWFLPALSAFQAWDVRNASPGIVVAVIDNGIQLDHEDLRGRLWVNAKEIAGNAVDDDGNGYVDDVNGWNFHQRNGNPGAEYVAQGDRACKPHPTQRLYERHATHVAGTIGALAGNGRGGVGISHDVRIMALKALGGPCGAGRSADILEAIAYAVRHGAHIVNMSLGGPKASDLMRRELEAAVAAGVLVVAAVGNEGKDIDREPRYPAAFPIPGLVAVAALGPDRALAPFSNFGARAVDLAAPGVKILNAVPTGDDPRRAESGYAMMSGTSMATPIVTGAAALMRAHNRDLDPAEIERRLLRSVDPAPALTGRVRAAGTLNLARLLIEAARPYQRPVAPVARLAPRPIPAPALAPAPAAKRAPAAPPVVPKETRMDGISIEGPGHPPAGAGPLGDIKGGDLK